MSALITPLAGIFRGPILVIGGGMTVLDDLKALGQQDYAAVISANGHAFRLPGQSVDFIVCKDHRHTETGELMRDNLRPFNTPIVSQHWWADYRLPEWQLQVNSGLMAIAVAALLGGSPIYPVGFDFYQKGTYWYDPAAPNMSRGRTPREIRRPIVKTSEAVLGAQVRPVSGLLMEVFRPRAVSENYREPAIVQYYRSMQGALVEARREFALRFDSGATVPAGARFWMSEGELRMPNGYENVNRI